MKARLITILIVLSLGSVGCSTNTQNENTAAGAVSGAIAGAVVGNAVVGKGTRHGLAIGSGIVVGSLIGAAIGYYIDSTDHNTTYPFMSKNYQLIQPDNKAVSKTDD